MKRRTAIAALTALTAEVSVAQGSRVKATKNAQESGTVAGERWRRGIYVQQATAENKKSLYHLIQQSLTSGVDRFVVDLWKPSRRYAESIGKLRQFGIGYVPRITVFPHGGTPEQVGSKKYWDSRWQLVEEALQLGAQEVQLDYIRYSSRTPASPRNAINIHRVIRYFKERVAARQAKLQIDIFGVAAHRPSPNIGQDIALFAPDIDAVCPMVYPSHYKPYQARSKMPYETVHGSLSALKQQLGAHPVEVFPYLELSNHRVPMNVGQRVNYVRAQLKASRDGGAQGWYAWSASNKYDLLFEILRRFGD